MLYFFGLDWWSLPHRVGVWIGSTTRGVRDEGHYLNHRVETSSEPERTSWITRCVLSCLLVAGESLLLQWLFSIGTIVGSPITLVISWATVLLLPKPTPRLPLFYARFLAMIFAVANMGSGFHWLKTQFPRVEPWGEVVGILGFIVWIGLCVWAFLAFRRPAERRVNVPVSSRRVAVAPKEASSNVTPIRRLHLVDVKLFPSATVNCMNQATSR